MQNWMDMLASRRIAVIGDVMLDRYISGPVERISPEAPVPVVRIAAERVAPGGAANVAANIASLGGTVDLVGLVGDDAERGELVAALQAIGAIGCDGLVAVPGRRSVSKLRIIGAHQQIVRVDREDATAPAGDAAAKLLHAATAAVDRADIVVLSDYGKEVCSDELLRAVIGRATAAGKPVLADPKRLDFSAYRGASILTPNRKELTDATRLSCETDDEARAAAAKAQAACGADILLTRSEKGMSFFPKEGRPTHLATVAQDVFDVSGAGDTVVAVLAAALVTGLPMIEAMRAANHAAGIVVSKLGTACVTPNELSASLSAEDGDGAGDGQLVDIETAAALRASWARQKLTVGFANGCFDLIHPGHVSLLRQAAQNCDRLLVALNTDRSTRRLKGPSRPVQDERARAEVIGAIKGVAAVILFDEPTPLRLIERLEPDLLVKGADYTIDTVVGADLVQARGGRVLLASLSEGRSTTRLIERMAAD